MQGNGNMDIDYVAYVVVVSYAFDSGYDIYGNIIHFRVVLHRNVCGIM